MGGVRSRVIMYFSEEGKEDTGRLVLKVSDFVARNLNIQQATVSRIHCYECFILFLILFHQQFAFVLVSTQNPGLLIKDFQTIWYELYTVLTLCSLFCVHAVVTLCFLPHFCVGLNN